MLLLDLPLRLFIPVIKAKWYQIFAPIQDPLDVGPVAPPNQDNQDARHDGQEAVMEEEAGNKDQDDWNQAAHGYHAGDEQERNEEAGAQSKELHVVA